MKKKQPNEQRITVLYARLSRDDEKEGISGSIQNQRAILEKFASDNCLPNPRFFFDDGYSGVSFTRPAFMEIMELAEQGLVANLVVKDHSRLGRNRLVVGQLLEEDFVRLNIRYIAIMDNIDTSNGVSDIVPMQDLFKNKRCLGGGTTKGGFMNFQMDKLQVLLHTAFTRPDRQSGKTL